MGKLLGKSGFAVGRVFCIPFLGGGYGYGYTTAVFSGSIFCNILDLLDDQPTADCGRFVDSPILIYDLQAGTDFEPLGLKKRPPYEPWFYLDCAMPGQVAPKCRYVRMGLPPRQVDILGIQPDRVLSIAEAERIPKVATVFSPGNTGMVEVLVKRLRMTGMDFLDEWEQGLVSSGRSVGTRRASKARSSASTQSRSAASSESNNPVVHISMPIKGEFPNAAQQRFMARISRMVTQAGLVVTDSGAGLGAMDLHVSGQASKTALLRQVRTLVSSVAGDRVVRCRLE
jgi:hypothetical protein